MDLLMPGETTIVGLLGKEDATTSNEEMALGPDKASRFVGGTLSDSSGYSAGVERCEACPYDAVYRGGTNKNAWNQYVCFYKPDGEIAATDVFLLDNEVLAELGY